MSKYQTLKKFTDNIPNEDNCHVSDNMIAISDGAGGCGVFAGDWSKYLVDKIAQRSNNSPITSFHEFDNWVSEIWEEFYIKHEQKAKEYDGIFQTKFYQEGSCATLAVIWRTNPHSCHWMAYGDSVVFHYSKSNEIFEHSFTKLSDFSRNPYLISCKDLLQEEGFKNGEFQLKEDSVVFAASDALSHYILMMYYITHQNKYKKELDDLVKNNSYDAQMVSIAQQDTEVTFEEVIARLQEVSKEEKKFEMFVKDLYQHGVLDIDDYTLAFLYRGDSLCSASSKRISQNNYYLHHLEKNKRSKSAKLRKIRKIKSNHTKKITLTKNHCKNTHRLQRILLTS